jgi:four helix bundle protein
VFGENYLMKEYKTYKDLHVWVSARSLCVEIYSLTKAYPASEQFGLTNQLRRAAISVASNIAEGHGRQYKKETIQFLHMAKGSLNELETQLLLSVDLNFATEKEVDAVLLTLESTRKQLIGFINYLTKENNLK